MGDCWSKRSQEELKLRRDQEIQISPIQEQIRQLRAKETANVCSTQLLIEKMEVTPQGQREQNQRSMDQPNPEKQSVHSLMKEDEGIRPSNEEKARIPLLEASFPDPSGTDSPYVRNADYLILVWYNSLLIKHVDNLQGMSEEALALQSQETSLLASILNQDLPTYLQTVDPMDPLSAFKLFALCAVVGNRMRLSQMSTEKLEKISEYSQTFLENAEVISNIATEQMLLDEDLLLKKRALLHSFIISFYLCPLEVVQGFKYVYFTDYLRLKAFKPSFWLYFDRVISSSPITRVITQLGAGEAWTQACDYAKTHTFFCSLQSHYGLYTFGGYIFISDEHVDSPPSTLVLLFHEMLHHIQRQGKKDALVNLFPSKTNEKSLTINESPLSFDSLLFGKPLHNLYLSAEKFLAQPENWAKDPEEFIREFWAVQDTAKENHERSYSISKVAVHFHRFICGFSGQ